MACREEVDELQEETQRLDCRDGGVDEAIRELARDCDALFGAIGAGDDGAVQFLVPSEWCFEVVESSDQSALPAVVTRK